MFSRKGGRTAPMLGVAVSLFLAGSGFAQPIKSGEKDSATATSAAKSLKPQTTCPIQGGEINKKLFVDYKGRRIYVCCKGCLAEVKKDPEAAIKKLESLGQSVEMIGNNPSGDTAAKAAETGY